MSALHFEGDLVAVGDLLIDDLRTVNPTRIAVRTNDGRVLLLVGLTHQECRDIANLAFLSRVSLEVIDRET